MEVHVFMKQTYKNLVVYVVYICNIKLPKCKCCNTFWPADF